MQPRNYVLFIFFLLMTLPGEAQVLSSDSIPVRLRTLDADRVNNSSQLDWKVTCYLDYAYFDVQRSSDGINYSTIHTFEADKLRCLDPFRFTEPATDETTYYRVRVGDLDGKFYNSKIVVVYGKVKGFDILFPGLLTQTGIPLVISSATAGTARVTIASLQGNVPLQQKVVLSKGNTQVPLALQGLPRGLYLLSVTNDYGATSTTRFLKMY